MSKIKVNNNQKGNPILEHIKQLPWEYVDIVPDYLVGQSNAVLFLSLKYYRLHPEYILTRAKTISNFNVRILLVLVDIPNSKEAIRELSIYTVACNITMILAWSEIDAGKYIETLKQYEHKSPDMIKEKVNEDSFAKLTSCLCQIKSVNKTDVVTLRSNFSCFKDIINAKEDKFKSLPGFGDEKVKKLITAFDTPFSNMDH